MGIVDELIKKKALKRCILCGYDPKRIPDWAR